MKKDVEIRIHSAQIMDGERDEMELFTTGRFYDKDGLLYLTYEETEATGFQGSTTVLKIGPGDRLTMTRMGKAHSQLVMETGKTHTCHYETGYGSMSIDVLGREMETEIAAETGRVFSIYELDLGGGILAVNEIDVQWNDIP